MNKVTKEQRDFWDTIKYSPVYVQDIRNNTDFLAAIELARKLGQDTIPPIDRFIPTLVDKYLAKKGFNLYSYAEDIKSACVYQCYVCLPKFNTNKSANPFAYLYTVISGAAFNYIGKENRQMRIKQDLERETWDDV